MQAEKSPDIQNSSLRSLLLIMAICFVSLIALLIFAGQQNVIASQDERQLVMQEAKIEVALISTQDGFFKPRTVYGRIESLNQTDLGFEFSGLLRNIFVKEGEEVKEGQVLAELDNARLLATRNELDSALKSAKANAKLAQLSTKRFADLVAKKVESQQRLDEAIANLDASNALVAEAEARLISLNVQLEKSILRSPFDGQITAQLVDRGTVVNTGQGIFTLLQTSTLEAKFGLPEQTAYKMVIGQDIELKANDSIIAAKVKSIANKRTFSTRTIEAVMDIKQDLSVRNMHLVSGDLVSLSINIPTAKKGAWIPLSALASAVRGLWTIYVVNQEQRIEQRLVSVEYANDKFAYITGAISDGDKVAVSGIHRLSPNQFVKNVLEVAIDFQKISGVDIRKHDSLVPLGVQSLKDAPIQTFDMGY